MKAKKEDDQRANPVSIMSQFDVWNIQRQYVYELVLLVERERLSDLTKWGYDGFYYIQCICDIKNDGNLNLFNMFIFNLSN